MISSVESLGSSSLKNRGEISQIDVFPHLGVALFDKDQYLGDSPAEQAVPFPGTSSSPSRHVQSMLPHSLTSLPELFKFLQKKKKINLSFSNASIQFIFFVS